MPSPAPRGSAGLRFAVRSLSEAIDREKNKVRRPGWHLIHRGAVPLPLIGEGLSGAPGMGINLVVKVHYALGSRKR